MNTRPDIQLVIIEREKDLKQCDAAMEKILQRLVKNDFGKFEEMKKNLSDELNNTWALMKRITDEQCTITRLAVGYLNAALKFIDNTKDCCNMIAGNVDDEKVIDRYEAITKEASDVAKLKKDFFQSHAQLTPFELLDNQIKRMEALLSTRTPSDFNSVNELWDGTEELVDMAKKTYGRLQAGKYDTYVGFAEGTKLITAKCKEEFNILDSLMKKIYPQCFKKDKQALPSSNYTAPHARQFTPPTPVPNSNTTIKVVVKSSGSKQPCCSIM